ncbi:MAG TPA: DUF2330 domain-containing protein [Polyangiaceae bacterium]|nr:DUF2330 domain-containing protein [Polyangiaceae bacterium]
MALGVKVRVSIAGAIATLSVTSAASACGGFFCDLAQPVNQAAEQIIFAQNDDDTVTAVIQIMYAGPSQSFSWLLPISGVPTSMGVASNTAFQRLKARTNPSYLLTTRVEGNCAPEPEDPSFGNAGEASGGEGGAGDPGPGGVDVKASGVVGPFEWTVIAVDAGASDPATVAVTWLGDNGYDVPSAAPGLLGPYLADGLNLLALRLTKGVDAGSIRPIVITYPGTQPSIPIKLTAVAANEDMGVLAWLLAPSRGVPENYYALELNEALINWFNPAPTYGDVVTAAANDAGGKGFVTEFAGAAAPLAEAVWGAYDEDAWQAFLGASGTNVSPSARFLNAYYSFGQYDGFWDAVKEGVTLASNRSIDDLESCPSCYASDVDLEPNEFAASLKKWAIEPMRTVHDLLAAHPVLTRLYTTMSADEMDKDPLFTFNPDLPDVSNVHTAERVIECHDDVYESNANWHVDLPQGGRVRGTSSDASSRRWLASGIDGMPANRRILQVSGSGAGVVVEDSGSDIDGKLDAFNESVPEAPTVPASSGGTSSASKGGKGGTSSPSKGGATATGGSGGTTSEGGAPSDGTSGRAPARAGSSNEPSGGCSLSVARGDSTRWLWIGLGVAAFGARKRRRA